MHRVIITVKGRVQGVGYRDFVREVARQLEINGYVENVKPYDVRVIAEGERRKLKEFIDRIKSARFPAVVEKIEVREEEATGEFEYFEIRRGRWEEELGERLDFAAHILYGIMEKQDKHIELTKEILSKQDRHIELTEKILEKQDLMLEKQDTMLGKMDLMLEKQDETIKEIRKTRVEIKGEISKTNELLEKRFERMEREIERIKKALIKAGIEV